jgi:predicted phage tail protein
MMALSPSPAWHDPDKYARIDTGAIIDQRPVSVIRLATSRRQPTS